MRSLRLGAWWLGLRQKFGHGVKVAYYRDVVAPQIIETAPIRETNSPTAEVHVLTSGADWINLLWTLKSFYHVSREKFALCIHADQTIDEGALKTLESHFPHGRVIRRPEADQQVKDFLRGYPKCLHFRNTNLLAPKVFDFLAYLGSDRMALFDSDLLFFAEPREYLRYLCDPDATKNAFNADIGSAYTVDAATVQRRCGFELQPMINSGLGAIHRASLRLDWLEEFLYLPGILEGHFWRIEQTLYALCSSKFGVELLPEPYTLSLKPGLGNRPFRHYNGRIRHLMYSEGMRTLRNGGFLDKIREAA